jgi:hypothetical protein
LEQLLRIEFREKIVDEPDETTNDVRQAQIEGEHIETITKASNEDNHKRVKTSEN